MTETHKEKEKRRAEINSIDAELLKLLNRRAEIALWLGELKSQEDISLCDHDREREVIARLRGANPGPLDDQSVGNIFQRIIDESLHLQQRTYQKKAASNAAEKIDLPRKSRVAILGEPGSFSEEAAMVILGKDCQTVSCSSFEDLFQSVARDAADYILSPLENSLVGSVHRCVDLLLDSSFNIVAEIVLPVSHYLVGCPDSSFEMIRTVESHPVALAQCEMFFASNPQLRGIAADDTAGSVRRIVESNDLSRAALGSKRAAEIYGGKILREHVEDHSENYTRFVLLSSTNDSNHGNKISLVLRLKHNPGALHSALRPFVRRGINLLKIESRPIKGDPSQFNFYFDLEVPASEGELRAALDEIGAEAESVRYLGRYSTVGGVEQAYDLNS